MAQITTLKDRQGQTVYPVTSSKAVFNDKGEDLEALLAAQQRKLDGQLKGYAKTEELQKKQDALSVTEDLRLTGEGLLGLTERAKQRLFDDLWREAVGVWGDIDHSHVEDDVAKPYYLNELWLTYEEAVAVYEAGAVDSPWIIQRYYGMAIKTNLPIRCASWAPGSSTDLKFRVHEAVTASDIEVFNLSTRRFDFCIQPEPGTSVNVTSFAGPRLRRIIGALNCRKYTGGGSHRLFGSCPMLEDVSVLELNADLDLSGCPRINTASLGYLVSRRYTRDGKAITVTLYPDVFAKLTDEANAEWHQVLLDASNKDITFATA